MKTKTHRLFLVAALPVALVAFFGGRELLAFCGFYVAKADTKLFNEASRVVMVRQGDRTVLTMANDFKGDAKDFAVVIPVPTFLEREQINVAEPALLDHLDAYTSPRLVEYFDDDPCRVYYPEMTMDGDGGRIAPSAGEDRDAAANGVKIEARYSVGEYDILILSAQESSGLEVWLKKNGYKIPEGAGSVLGSYIKQNMRFFVAKVNLKEQQKAGFSYLRPLQVAYESPKFMLPIRLGTVNAKGPQELFIFALTSNGRVETTNYRTVRLPTGNEVPAFVKNDFANFYRAMFSEQTRKENNRAVFLEYAWDMAWCDPCAADPLSREQLQKLGVFWLGAGDGSPAVNTFVTRLHVRYDAAHFPEDLVFQETGDRNNFQGRYVIRHPFKGEASCAAGVQYRKSLPQRQEQEVRTLASLTGWSVDDLRKKGGVMKSASPDDGKWWKKLWGN